MNVVFHPLWRKSFLPRSDWKYIYSLFLSWIEDFNIFNIFLVCFFQDIVLGIINDIVLGMYY